MLIQEECSNLIFKSIQLKAISISDQWNFHPILTNSAPTDRKIWEGRLVKPVKFTTVEDFVIRTSLTTTISYCENISTYDISRFQKLVSFHRF